MNESNVTLETLVAIEKMIQGIYTCINVNIGIMGFG
jgi:hypothetical protein